MLSDGIANMRHTGEHGPALAVSLTGLRCHCLRDRRMQHSMVAWIGCPRR